MLVMNKVLIICTAFLTVATASVITSCSNNRSTGIEYARNMYDPIAYNPDQPNKNFKDGKTAQTPPAGTSPVGFDKNENYPNTPEGYQAASAGLSNPLPVTVPTLEQGKTLYLNMCSHCHGNEGKGDGSIVKMEKFPAPPSYSTGNSSRGGSMKDLTDGKIYHTITYGLNLMGPHKYQLTPEQRWKIVMYVHELQKLQ
ncbi:Cytochrome C oxidase, cbb3-type, subunit III [Daejeonella lutea]|uniref:Cytochrome C oxidase, cbb3-type, subunit III n=2 Tax=Daejeonella lutea TaxID=572036 RepID=A0A1T5D0R6_9SPHI|nr:cytochrome c [Daejeonella lutea]SKB65328.1 Cytochrome C oxidase, cbb3-type, subunit III [Daejeonella lutea]